jgi:predicted acetyltransferase
MDLHLAPATATDLPDLLAADGRAFGVHPTDPALTDELALVDPARFLLARDGDDVAGVTGSFPFRLTVPGGAALAVAGVSWVSVSPTHRRRGVLRALMSAQHRDLVDAGVVASALTATEGGIYGRFGYGPATVQCTVEIDRTRAAFRPTAPDPGGVRLAGTDQARAHAPAVLERWRGQAPGALSRDDGRWGLLFADREPARGGASALFFLLHPDGYAAYRVDRAGRRCHVVDLVAATDDAHAALWRVLLGLDMVTTVTSTRFPPDDPLPFLLTDPRLVRTTAVADGMWLRLLDVAAALAARTYAVEVDVVLEVGDAFLERGGRFRLRGGPDGAECAPCDAPVDVHTDVATLGALYLGGHRATTAARAAVLHAADPTRLRRLDAALAADRAPQHGTHF